MMQKKHSKARGKQWVMILVIVGILGIGLMTNKQEVQRDELVLKELSGRAISDEVTQDIIGEVLNLNLGANEDYVVCGGVDPLPLPAALPTDPWSRPLPLYQEVPGFDAVTIHLIRMRGTCDAIEQGIAQGIDPDAELILSMQEPVCPAVADQTYEFILDMQDATWGVYDAADGGQAMHNLYQSLLAGYGMPTVQLSQEDVCVVVAYFSWKCTPISPIDVDRCEAVAATEVL